MAYVNLKHMPKPNKEYAVNFQELNGGLNLSELEHRLSNKESPAMRNLLWREGVLCSRDGQEWVVDDDSLGVGYAMYERLFYGCIIAHIGAKLYVLDPEEDSSFSVLCSGVPAKRGTFFHYYDNLYYKTVGAYFRIAYNTNAGTFSASAVEGYVPILLINADPATAAGDLYQPENRIQPKKTVKYNAASGVTDYYLPVQNVTSVGPVVVDGVTLTENTDYTVDLTNGKVVFSSAPPVTNPATNNTVAITYSKANTDAYNSVMDCPYAITYGGSGDLCVVVGGCSAQPNAFFWNGNTSTAMDPTYFPMSQYQLVGDTDDKITGFGKQQSFLVVFKEHSIGRAKQSTTEIDGRAVIDMPYILINDKIGCDLPWSIQLIDNNLVWCNREQGVHILKDSSYAYENNIENFSLKVNGGSGRQSLLRDVRSGGVVCSVDDSKRYWLCAGKHVWVWDYENTNYKTPSWYFFTNITPVAFAVELSGMWHLDAKGRLTKFSRFFRDYGGPIDKSFRFTAQHFGGYDRLKNINSVLIALRPDTDCDAVLTYITDAGSRKDLSNLVNAVWRLVPRNLRYRNLSGAGFGAVFRRRPMCKRVRHFSMQLDNNIAGQDLAIVSAQVFYNYQGGIR